MEIGRRDQGNRKTLSQINVTPFVDVMLVLLIVFMVTAPMLERGVDVDLPDAEASSLKQTSEPLVISVQKNGGVYIGRSLVDPPESLTPVLAQILREREKKEVYLEADGGVVYERVVQVMAAAQKAGVERVGMVSELPDR